MKSKLSLLLVLVAIGACAGHTQSRPAQVVPQAKGPATATHENLNAVVWMQTALEYQASALQAFRLAQLQLDVALADPAWSAAVEQQGDASKLPPAVILDIDETVLDNSYYQARLIRDHTLFAIETWDAWVQEGQATAIPGAREFTQYAVQKGVTVFYVTNRTANLEAVTRKNLAAEQLPVSATVDTVLSPRRAPRVERLGQRPPPRPRRARLQDPAARRRRPRRLRRRCRRLRGGAPHAQRSPRRLVGAPLDHDSQSDLRLVGARRCRPSADPVAARRAALKYGPH